MLPLLHAPPAYVATEAPGRPATGTQFAPHEWQSLWEQQVPQPDGLLPVLEFPFSDDLPKLIRAKRYEVKRQLVAQTGCCSYCGHKFGKKARVTLDHFIPISRGGTHYVDNLRIVCGRCNFIKANLMPEQWVAELTRIVDAIQGILRSPQNHTSPDA